MPRSYRLARLISDLLSPPVVALAVFWVLAGGTGHSSRWPIFLTCVATQSFFPLAFLGVAVRNGSLGDVNMSRREERRFGLLALGLVYMAGLALAALLGVRGPVLFVCICTLAVIGALWAVNLVYKASGHVAGLTAYMAAVSIFIQPLHAGLVLIPAVSWARVRTGAHTHLQVVSGAVLGAGVAIGFYYLTRNLLLGT